MFFLVRMYSPILKTYFVFLTVCDSNAYIINLRVEIPPPGAIKGSLGRDVPLRPSKPNSGWQKNRSSRYHISKRQETLYYDSDSFRFA